MSFSFGPGLTSQLGPFKFNRRDREPVQKSPWKGGGVAGGGQRHAGHGNWFSSMNPIATPMKMGKVPLNVATSSTSIVSTRDVYKPSYKRGPPNRFKTAVDSISITTPSKGVQKAQLGQTIGREPGTRERDDGDQKDPSDFSDMKQGSPVDDTAIKQEFQGITNYFPEIKSEPFTFTQSVAGDVSMLPGSFPIKNEYHFTDDMPELPDIPAHTLQLAETVDILDALHELPSAHELALSGRLRQARNRIVEIEHSLELLQSAPTVSGLEVRDQGKVIIESQNAVINVLQQELQELKNVHSEAQRVGMGQLQGLN